MKAKYYDYETFQEACETFIEQGTTRITPGSGSKSSGQSDLRVNMTPQRKKGYPKDHIFSSEPGPTPEEIEALYQQSVHGLEPGKTAKFTPQEPGATTIHRDPDDPYDVLSSKPAPDISAVIKKMGPQVSMSDIIGQDDKNAATAIHQQDQGSGPISPGEFRDFMSSFTQFKSGLNTRLSGIEQRLQSAGI